MELNYLDIGIFVVFFVVVVGVSLVSGTTVGAVLGVLVPSFCEWVGIDPAIAAGPFIVTLIDTSAITLYLAVATAMLTVLV